MAPSSWHFAAGVMVTLYHQALSGCLNISENGKRPLNIIYALALVALVFAFVGFDILSVADTAMVAYHYHYNRQSSGRNQRSGTAQHILVAAGSDVYVWSVNRGGFFQTGR